MDEYLDEKILSDETWRNTASETDNTMIKDPILSLSDSYTLESLLRTLGKIFRPKRIHDTSAIRQLAPLSVAHPVQPFDLSMAAVASDDATSEQTHSMKKTRAAPFTDMFLYLEGILVDHIRQIRDYARRQNNLGASHPLDAYYRKMERNRLKYISPP